MRLDIVAKVVKMSASSLQLFWQCKYGYIWQYRQLKFAHLQLKNVHIWWCSANWGLCQLLSHSVAFGVNPVILPKQCIVGTGTSLNYVSKGLNELLASSPMEGSQGPISPQHRLDKRSPYFTCLGFSARVAHLMLNFVEKSGTGQPDIMIIK